MTLSLRVARDASQPPRKLVVAVDVDEVCADLIGEWLRRYNRDYDDSLTPENITEWDIDKCVKPLCGSHIFKYLDDADLYDHVLPIPKARKAVYDIAALGHRVIFVSSCVVGSVDPKVRWLQRWGFLPHGHSVQNFIAASDKSLVIADILVDDRIKNVESFHSNAFLVTRPHNAKHKCSRERVEGLETVAGFLRDIPHAF